MQAVAELRLAQDSERRARLRTGHVAAALAARAVDSGHSRATTECVLRQGGRARRLVVRMRSDEQNLGAGQTDAEKQSAKELLEALGSVRFGLAAMRVERGLGLSFLSVFPKENETVKKFLSAIRGGDGASSLRGLPDE